MTDEKDLIKAIEGCKDQLKAIVDEARELRYGLELPPAQATSTESLEALLLVRQRLDRLEELYINSLLFKNRASAIQSQATELHEELWDKIVSAFKTASVKQGGEYLGAKEKYADANMQTLESKRALRLATEFLDHCNMVLEVVKSMKYGLESVRGDILAVIRSHNFETSLER